jgi:hypothetical protein
VLPVFAVFAWGACSDSADAPPIQPTAGVEAAITINQPQPRAAVAVPFAISGAANVFEGALSVRVLDASGGVLCEHNDGGRRHDGQLDDDDGVRTAAG